MKNINNGKIDPSIKESLKTIIKEHKKHFNFDYQIKAGNPEISQNLKKIQNEINILIDDCNNVSKEIKNRGRKFIRN